MSDDPAAPRPSDDSPWRRWPLSLPLTLALGLVAAVLIGGVAWLFGSDSPEAQARRTGLSIAVYEPPTPAVDPGERMDVMKGARDDFDGVPERPEPEPIQLGDWVQGAVVEPYAPPPRPVVTAPEITLPATVRRYGSDGAEDCTFARTRADAMVCREPRLGAFERDMRAAYDRAIERAADPGRVARDQRRWERARENAAIDGPEAVETVYRQRLAELDF